MASLGELGALWGRVLGPATTRAMAIVCVLAVPFGCSTDAGPKKSENIGVARQAATTCTTIANCPSFGTCHLCAAADTTFYSSNTALNNGIVDAMCVGASQTTRAGIRFNVANLPANINITSATLTVTARRMSGCSNTITDALTLNRINAGTVVELGVTPPSLSIQAPPAAPDPVPPGSPPIVGINRDHVCGTSATIAGGPCGTPGVADGTASSSSWAATDNLTARVSSLAPVGGIYTFSGTNVSNDVRNWYNGSVTNRGWMLTQSVLSAAATVISARNGAEWPVLSVTYTRALGQSCTANSQCVSPAQCVDGVCCNSACGANCTTSPCTNNTSDCLACNLGGGICSNRAPGSACGSATNTDCTDPDTCDGSAVCQPNHASAATLCTDTDGNECTQARCNGSGTCNQNNNVTNGTACGSSSDTDCTNPDTCLTGVCQANHAANGSSCTDTDGNQCTQALCSAGNCLQNNSLPNGTACGSSSDTDCTDPDTCSSGVCQNNHIAGGVACTDTDLNDCTVAQCNGSGTCNQAINKAPGAACGSATNNDCTDPDTCNGSGTCLPNHAGNGVACTDSDGNVCTQALCNGTGTCVQSNNLPNGTACTSDSNPCSVDQCTSGTCTHNTPGGTGLSCRPASCNGDDLTQGEVCTGVSTVCPGPNVVTCSGTCTAGACNDCTTDASCGADRYCLNGACFDQKPNGDPCTGNNQCDSNFCVDGRCCESACGSTVSGGVCTTSPCSGGTTDCQACNNSMQLGLCRPVATATSCADTDGNECTFAQCNATGTCTQNNNDPAGTGCGSSVDNDCTNPDSCLNGVCQPNHASNTTACADTDGNDCTAALCNGTGTCVQANNKASGAACGSAADTDCTNPDTCNGTGACQPNHAANGAACTETDGNPCTAALCNGSGTCTQNNNRPQGTTCTDDLNPCTVDECNASGTCTHPAGNAGDLCRASAGVCDVLENCDGASTSCPPNVFLNTQCRAASCTNGVATLAASCPGNAAGCPAVITDDCFPFACGATACRTTCSTDAHCDADGFCAGTICEPQRPNGTGCDADNQCLSNQCTDGVCCNSACPGQCQACDVAGSEGTCTPVPNGGLPHGTRPPCEADGSACDGFCNGNLTSACSYPGSNTQCRAPTCSAGVGVLAAVCNGSGSCPAVQTQECAPYICDATACFGDCTVDAHCDPDSWCSSNVCVPKLPLGDACNSDGQCDSAHCIDGVCCDRLCPGQCEACDGDENPGTCSPIQGIPHGGRIPCVADPEGSVCDGYCDGTVTTSCTYPGAGTVCRDAACQDGVATVGATCDGSGVCPVEQMVTCAPYQCSGVACDGDCRIDSECALNEFCLAGVCTQRKAAGQPCASSNSCLSGVCADGFCCNQTCTGQCEACDVAGSEGLCVPVPANQGPHGTRPACTGTLAPCAGSCNGVERQGCTYPGDTVPCREADCTNNVATLAAFCNGEGQCPAVQLQACHPLACNAAGTICEGPCTTNADCTAEAFCSAGFCLPKRPTGTPCGSDAQCETNQCVDGVCCDRACTGQCEACDMPGLEGTCSNVPFGLPHGGRPSCGGVGPCTARCTADSSTSCTFPGAEVACGAGSCINGVSTDPPVCNAAGTCLQATTTVCGAYACGESECRTDCVTSDHCEQGYECVNGACMIPEPGTGGAGGDNTGAEGGMPPSEGGQGGTPGAGASGGTSGAGGMANGGVAGMAPPGGDPGDDGGCGCEMPGSRAPKTPWAALAALGLMGVALRRSSRHARAA